MKFRTYNHHSFTKSPYYERLPEKEKKTFRTLSQIFHFKANNYVLDHLINWEDVPNDPIYQLVFPREEMVFPQDYDELQNMEGVFNEGTSTPLSKEQEAFYQKVRYKMRPQIQVSQEAIRPCLKEGLPGVYHIFSTMVNLFPSPMLKTCHAYCTYCFRWIAFKEVEVQSHNSYTDPQMPVSYLQSHPEVTDVQFTGADPMILKAAKLREFMEPILGVDSVKVIRICTKSLAFWPFRYTTDEDAKDTLALFRYIQSKGKHLSLTAHFTHVRELENPVVEEAIRNIRSTGAMIRCQGPLVKGINDTVEDLTNLWNRQVELGMVPYYLFMEAGHNESHCFRVTIARSLQLFREARKKATNLARTVRGPVFMNDEHRVMVTGVAEVGDENYFVLKSLQAPPNTTGEGDVKLVSYNKETTDLGDLASLFKEKNS